jgi:hypothetical protein
MTWHWKPNHRHFRERFAKVYRQCGSNHVRRAAQGEAVSDVAARLTQGVRKSLKKQTTAGRFRTGQFACAIARCELEDGDYEKFGITWTATSAGTRLI